MRAWVAVALLAVAVGLLVLLLVWTVRDTAPPPEPAPTGPAERVRVTAAQLPSPPSWRPAQARGAAPALPPQPPAGPEPLRIDRDPRSADFDAAKLFGASGDDVLTFFRSEQRDEAWATAREEDLTAIALPRLQEVDPDAMAEVECHTATCRVRVHSRSKYLTAAMGSYPLQCLANVAVPLWGPGIEESGPGSAVADPYSDFYLIFGQETRTREGMLDANADRCVRYRDVWMKRTGQGSGVR